MITNDKRWLPRFGTQSWAERTSERQWHYCAECRHDVPTFILTEGLLGTIEPDQKLRCCWECGWALERVPLETVA